MQVLEGEVVDLYHVEAGAVLHARVELVETAEAEAALFFFGGGGGGSGCEGGEGAEEDAGELHFFGTG